MIKNLLLVLSFIPILGFSQTKIILGTVTGDQGMPLEMCKVSVQNLDVNTTTDESGNFSIKVEKGQTLMFNLEGYESQTIQVGDENNLAITLKETKSLKEVVVTSLGILKDRKTLTYAAQNLKAEELNRVKDPSLVNTLSGKIAGMIVTKSSSGMGGSTKVVIRGNTSTRDTQPLYVVDGIPMLNVGTGQPNQTFGGITNRDGGDLVSQLNPEDFESISVLKGSSASALYGILGANGVILLNTSKGEKNKFSAKLSSTTLFENVQSLPKFQTEYRAASANSIYSWTTDNQKENFANHVPGFFRTGVTQTTALNLSDSKENSFTNLSLAHLNSTAVMPETDLTRYNLGLKHARKLFDDKLGINMSVNYANSITTNRPNIGLYLNPLTGLYLMPRGNGNDFSNFKNNFEVFDPTRNLMTQNWPVLNNPYEQNPYWQLKRNKHIEKSNLLNVNFALDYKVAKWMNLSGRYSYTTTQSDFDKKLYAGTTAAEAPSTGRYFISDSKSTQKYADFMAKFNTEISQDFSFDAILGTSVLNRRIGEGKYMDSGLSGLLYVNIFNISAFTSASDQAQSLGSDNEVQSVFATSNLGYKNYLFLQLTARNDWSSSLVNTDNISFFYPSIGISGIISEMFKLPDFVDFLKIRTSYAQTGNDINAFVTSPTTTISGGQIINPIVGQDPNRPLQPEKKKEFEIGAEIRLFRNKLGLDITYYSSKTYNQYVEVDASDTHPLGYLKYAINAGTISNKGIEIMANAKIINTANFNWTSNVNFAKNVNEVTELNDNTSGEIVITESGSNGYQFSLLEGKPFGVIKGKVIERDEQGRIKLDAAGNIMISKTLQDVGNANPDFMLTFGNTFKYKNFFANFLIDGRFGGEVMSMTESVNDFYGVSKASGDARNAGGIAINAVNSDGSAFSGLYNAQKYYTSVAGRDGALGEYMYSATNIVLRELSLGYTFNKGTIPYINSMDISLVGRNLFFIQKDAPFDPNISLSTGTGLQGIDAFGLPSTRTLGININIKF